MRLDALFEPGLVDDLAFLVVLLQHFLYVVLTAEIDRFVFGAFGKLRGLQVRGLERWDLRDLLGIMLIF